ncbi:MAG: hypothetical protein V4543_05290 [Bacteroidota bacterium]
MKKLITKLKSLSGPQQLIVVTIATIIVCSLINIVVGDNNQADSNSEPQQFYRKGDYQRTGYFLVKANYWGHSKRINTGNEFSSIGKREGTRFVQVNISYYNESSEGRVLSGCGYVTLYNGGRAYKYDMPETILAEGYGLTFETLNPMLTHTTTVVFPIPFTVNGPIYWTPEGGYAVYLGNI